MEIFPNYCLAVWHVGRKSSPSQAAFPGNRLVLIRGCFTDGIFFLPLMSLSFILRVVLLTVIALPGRQTISRNSSHLAPWDLVLRFKARNCHTPRSLVLPVETAINLTPFLKFRSNPYSALETGSYTTFLTGSTSQTDLKPQAGQWVRWQRLPGEEASEIWPAS